MRPIVSWFVYNPVAANMLMIMILFLGLLSAFHIRIEGFPKIPADTVEVSIVQIGASAQQMKESVTSSVEQALEGVPGAKRVSSISSNSASTLYIQKENYHSLNELLEEVRSRVDNITTLPLQAERPQVRRALFNYPALIVQIYGDVNQDELQKVARIIRQRLLAKSEISEISQWGERKKEISIELKPQTLRAYELDIADVAELVTNASLEYRTGELNINGTRIQVRADWQAKELRQFLSLPLFTDDNGGIVRLEDIATVVDGFADEDMKVTYQGVPAIGFEIKISQNGDLLKVNDAVVDVIKQADDILSHNIKADVWANQSQFASERLSMLQTNAWQGLALVFIMLSLFLHVRVAFWVAVGIPICIAGTLTVMDNYLGYSLNDITTFGIIIVLGLLVDDAVVVGESVFSERQLGSDPQTAAIEGTDKVATATVFGVLTTIAAFFPMTMLDDPFGKVFGSFAVVVVVALFFSIIESKLILPSHLASVKVGGANGGFFSRVAKTCQDKLNHYLSSFLVSIYKPLISFCVHNRWPFLIVFFSIFYFFSGLLSLGLIRTTFFPDIPSKIITVNLETDARLSHQLTLINAHKIVSAAEQLNQQWRSEFDLDGPPIEKLMMAAVGTSNAQIYAELSNIDSRPFTAMEILEKWRSSVDKLEGARKLTFTASEEAAGGFEVVFYANDQNSLQNAVNKAMSILNSVPNVQDVASDLQAGTPEVRLSINQKGLTLGLTASAIAEQVGNAFGGIEIQRFQRGIDEVKVFLRYPLSDRQSHMDLLNSEIRLEDGSWVPMAAVVNIESHYVPQWIWRKDFKDAATVSANIDKRLVSSPQVYQVLVKEMASYLKGHPGVSLKPAGELEEEEELSASLWKAFFFACLLIYILLAIPLKSYIQPMIIISVVPFGFVGAAIGHIVMDIPFSALSFFGMLALTGIVVNDSLILVSRYNQLIIEGTENALYLAAASRVRAVFLTTVTTVVGLLPILFETSEQAQYLIPAAVSLVFGELFATLITLVLVPILISFTSSKQIQSAADTRQIVKPQNELYDKSDIPQHLQE
jgi:multidrug efflux pump subunit AcrB